jgi:alkylhydroperoxidase family enzyme
MTWLRDVAGATDINDLLALRPTAAARLSELEQSLWDGGIDPTIVELVRTRVGQLLGLPGGPVDPTARSEREQAAIDFAEQYVLDPHGITDQQTAALHRLFSEPELTALTFCVAVYDALARAAIVLGAADEVTA